MTSFSGRSGTAILQDSLREFSTSVYADLKGSKPKTNLIFSPVSIAVALYNLLLGARGETRTQLEDALRLPSEFFCVHFETKKLKEVIKDTLGMCFIPLLSASTSKKKKKMHF
uniref:Serpin domain-containing protein n=1 Tax=Sinocyclocheilus rhinocerous TaxID=307959 RepID=A0A673LW40_9TELE